MAGRSILQLLGICGSQNICLHHSEFNALPILRLEIHIERERDLRLNNADVVRHWLGLHMDENPFPG